MKKELCKYEHMELHRIHEWKQPSNGYLSKIIKVVTYPVDFAGEQVMKIPGIKIAIEKSVGGLVSLTNDAAQWSISSEAVYRDYRNHKHAVEVAKDIHKLDLEDVDKVIGYLGVKYKLAAAGLGGGAGASSMLNPAIGAAAIAGDVTGLVALNLRSIGEYGTYCGFDMSSQAERLFAMNVLAYASSPSDTSKATAMAQLVKISQDVARKKTWEQLRNHYFVSIIENIAKALGVRLTKAKLAQVIPGVSVGIGAGFNAYFTTKVGNAAFYLYRERLLAAKYGKDIIEEVVKAAATFNPDYEDSNEAPDADAESTSGAGETPRAEEVYLDGTGTTDNGKRRKAARAASSN